MIGFVKSSPNGTDKIFMGPKVRIALIGYGYWGRNLLRNLATHKFCELVGVCDSSSKRVDEAKANYPSVLGFTDVAQMLSECHPEAVVIATPPRGHASVAVAAIQAGCHVLIEKPMATSSEECEQILAAASKAEKKIMIDNTLLFYPPVQTLMDLIGKGELGNLLYYDSVRANLGGFQPQVNVLWDLAPHEFSILDRLMGNREPQEIVAVGNKHFGSRTESVCYLNLKYAGNFNAHLHLNWSAPVKIRRLTIAGDRRMVELDDGILVDKLKIYDKGVKIKNNSVENFEVEYHSGGIVVPAIEQKEALGRVLDEFVSAIHEGRESVSDGLAGARVVRMLEAASTSLKNRGRPEKVASTLSLTEHRKAS